jgi:hypothetical protein
MTQTFGLNSNHDLYLGPDGNLVVLTGVEAIATACVTACLTQLGECVLETGVGLPNFQTVWVGTPDLAIWQSYLQDTILNVDGVTQVDSIRLTINNNVLNFAASISTIYGPTTISG